MPAHRKPTAIPRFEDPGRFRIDVYERTDRPGFRVVTRNGRARPIERSAPTVDAAEALANQIWELYQRGHYGPPRQDPLTLEQLAKAVVDGADIGEKSADSYERVWTLFVRHVGPQQAPRRIYQLHVLGFLSAVEDGKFRARPSTKPTSSYTLATYLRTLRAGFRFALKKHWITFDPTEDVSVEVEHEMGTWLPYTEWEPYLTACSNYHRIRSEAVLEFGLRESELAFARPEWIVGDVGRRALVVPVHDPVTGFRAKWGSSRPIPFSARGDEVVARALETWPKSAFLFSQDGLSALGNLAKHTRMACAESGVTRVTFHGLRRSAGAHWLDCGVPLSMVSRLLGHKDERTTRNWYAGMSDSTIAGAMELVDQVRAAHATRGGLGERLYEVRQHVANDCGGDCGAPSRPVSQRAVRSRIRSL